MWLQSGSGGGAAEWVTQLGLHSSTSSEKRGGKKRKGRSVLPSGWSTEPESSRSQSALVPRTGVLVGSDGHQLQDPLSTGAVHPTGSEVNKDQVVVRST